MDIGITNAIYTTIVMTANCLHVAGYNFFNRNVVH